ncbi:UNVERIFIED_ORG: hypothetical protein ABIC54_001625 [Burkholderia sp. 1263]
MKRYDFSLIAGISCADAAYIDISSPCEPWHGNVFDPKGYPVAYLAGKTRRVARYIYAVSRGIPHDFIDGLTIRHTCDNPACFNEKHLLAGTDAHNIADRTRRKRTATGERSGNAKLSDADVIAARAEYVRYDREHGSGALARRYGVTQAMMLRAIVGDAWAHLPGAVNA